MKVFFLSMVFITFIFSDQFITPLPQKIDFNKEKALLGKELFFDTRLSKNNTVSCATCHNLKTGGVDNLKASIGIYGQKGEINSPTVLNSFFNFRQMWDGRVKTLAQQAAIPIENPIEMGNNFKNLIATLNNDNNYKYRFNKIYNKGITKNNILDALAEFQKTLITQSPFDEYLRGDESAISKTQKEGYELFKDKGCVSCHNGINIGGATYSKIGIVNPRKTKNLGLYSLTKNELDKYYFKVPSLRNVELTYPYFHDAREQSLKKAIKLIGYVQLGLKLSDEEVEKIEAFLKSLTGKVELIQ